MYLNSQTSWNYVAQYYVSLLGSFIAFCTSNLSITALCKLDLAFVFNLIFVFGFGFEDDGSESSPNPGPVAASIGVVSLDEVVVPLRWGGTIIGMFLGGGGHCIK